MIPTRDTFATQGQWNKFCKVKTFFEKLIELKKQGCMFLVDGEMEENPYIAGYEMGFKSGNCAIAFVGATHSYNEDSGEYDIPWVDISVTELKKRVILLKKVKLIL